MKFIVCVAVGLGVDYIYIFDALNSLWSRDSAFIEMNMCKGTHPVHQHRHR